MSCCWWGPRGTGGRESRLALDKNNTCTPPNRLQCAFAGCFHGAPCVGTGANPCSGLTERHLPIPTELTQKVILALEYYLEATCRACFVESVSKVKCRKMQTVAAHTGYRYPRENKRC